MRLLGTPRATHTRCSPRLHKPSRPRRGYSTKSYSSSRPGRIREPVPVTTRPTRPVRALRTFPGSSFLSLRTPLRKGRAGPQQSSLTTRGTTSTRWWQEQECAPQLRLPSRPANSAGESGVIAAAAADGDEVAAGRRRSGLVARVPPGREGVGVVQSAASGTRGSGSPRRCCSSCSRRSCCCRRRRRRPRLSRRLH